MIKIEEVVQFYEFRKNIHLSLDRILDAIQNDVWSDPLTFKKSFEDGMEFPLDDEIYDLQNYLEDFAKISLELIE